jgi:hypothetical protein
MPGANYTTYLLALNHVETFLGASGVLKFCREDCKGACCAGCKLRGPGGCTEPLRHLACSMYICDPLVALLFGAEHADLLNRLRHEVGLLVRDQLCIELLYHQAYPPNAREILQRDRFIPSHLITEFCNHHLSKAEQRAYALHQLLKMIRADASVRDKIIALTSAQGDCAAQKKVTLKQ